MQEPKYLVVIGASSGGLNAISELIGRLDPRTDASYLIVMHLAKKGMSDFLMYRLKDRTTLPCVIAKDGDLLKRGTIYLAPVNHHLLVSKGKITLGNGPEENRWRPSIDVLFRSAAVSYGAYTIGIILTGYLSDGTSGMYAIKRCGGVVMVQDPNEAEVPDMPLSIIENMEVDYCLPLDEIGERISQLAQTERMKREIPQDLLREAEIGEKTATGLDVVSSIADPSVYACPDCGGLLWEVLHEKPGMTRFRCAIGHAYSEKDLSNKQHEAIEATLWVALRIMEERKNLFARISKDYQRKGLETMGTAYSERAKDMENHINKLKDILFQNEREGEELLAM